MKNPALHTITAIYTFFITLGRGKQCYLLKSPEIKKGDFRFIVFLNFIVRKRMTFAKFVSEKKGNFWFIVFLNFIARKRVLFAKFVSDKKGDFY